MGIRTSTFQVQSRKGVLGLVSGYFGVVEAQGRGSLHTHMLVWLKHVPNADAMAELLRNQDFQDRIVKYLRANIHADVEGLDENFAKETSRQSGVTYSRPLDPDAGRWKERFLEMEKLITSSIYGNRSYVKLAYGRGRHGTIAGKRRAFALGVLPLPCKSSVLCGNNTFLSFMYVTDIF